MAKSGKNGDRP